MIRTVIALFAFAVVLCGLIIFRPFAGGDDVAVDPLNTPAAQDDVEVTRAVQQQADTPLIAAPQEDPAIAAALQAVASQPAPAVVEAPRFVDVARPDTDDTPLDAMTQNVLAELGFAGVEPVETATQQQRESTAQILAGIEAATGQSAGVPDRSSLEELVVAALQAGQSDATIDAIINQAAAAGEIAVPEILVTSEGRVDTHVLLANIVTQAQIAAGNVPPIPTPTPDDTAGLEVRVVQRATEEVQARFYTVQPGDSLGAIAITFYGRSDMYDHIYQANRQILSSPDRIRIGQRLVIPQL
ncbi:MAG: LysM peptidoglycan-binding domain-containing protein [Pseudomonadota bacterium]